jgi:hypothetical protein
LKSGWFASGREIIGVQANGTTVKLDLFAEHLRATNKIYYRSLSTGKEVHMLRADSTLKRSILAAMLIVTAIASAGDLVYRVARAQDDRRPSPCCGLTTELIIFHPGETARLEVTNTASQGFPTGFIFVSKEGKVVSKREITIDPGKTEASDFLHPGGANRFELKAQFVSNDKKSIGLLRPVLRILDTATGRTLRIIGPEHFKKLGSARE